jgi:O-antigen/teichoic acid export membrane protein
MLTVVLMMAAEPFVGVVWGDQDFGFANVLRVTPPLILAVAYSALWIADSLTVASAVLVSAVVAGVMLVLPAGRVLRRHAFGRPDLALGRRTLWYGVRAHGDTVAALTNTRLDLLIMPAFLGSASVGLYSVAANVAGIILTMCGSLAAIVMPAAVRRGPDGPPLVVASLQVTLMVGGGLAAAIALVAGPAVDLVYGTEFAGSVTPLRLLLPGVVLMAAAIVIGAGLYAMNRPFTAFAAQLVGMAITVPGLVVFLPRGGPTVAALVSTISYSTVFALTLLAYLRVSGLRWRDLVAPAPWMRSVFSRSAWRAT